MTEVEQALKDMSEKYRAGLAQLQAQVENTKRSNSRQYLAAKQQQAMFCKEQWLIDKAKELAGGNRRRSRRSRRCCAAARLTPTPACSRPCCWS